MLKLQGQHWESVGKTTHFTGIQLINWGGRDLHSLLIERTCTRKRRRKRSRSSSRQAASRGLSSEHLFSSTSVMMTGYKVPRVKWCSHATSWLVDLTTINTTLTRSIASSKSWCVVPHWFLNTVISHKSENCRSDRSPPLCTVRIFCVHLGNAFLTAKKKKKKFYFSLLNKWDQNVEKM